MPAVMDQIRAWSANLSYWEQMTLNMVVSGRDLTEADYHLLLDYCMQDAGLVQMPMRPKIDFPRTYPADAKARYRLERLFNLRNVNALASGQELKFGPQLTAVYGNIGAGKTGYARPLGCAGLRVATGTSCQTPQLHLSQQSLRKQTSRSQETDRELFLHGHAVSVALNCRGSGY